MSEKKQLNDEQLKNASGGSPYSPPEYDNDDDYCVKNDTVKPVQTDTSKRDLDR